MLVLIARSGHLDVKVLTRLFIHPVSASLLLGLAALNMVLLTSRWWWIVNDTLRDFSLARSLKLNLIGNFFNFVFPSSIGGDVVRGYYLAQDFPDQKMKSALTVVVDRMIGLYSLISLATFSLLLISLGRSNSSLNTLTISTVLLFLGYTVCLILLASGLSKKILQKISFKFLQKPVNFLLSCHDYLKDSIRNPWLFFKSFSIGIVSQMMVAIFFYVVAVFIGEPKVTFIDLMSVTPLGFLVMSIPISPAGIGVGQVAYLFLIQQVTGRTSDFGPTAISAFQLGLLFWSLFGGWFYLTIKKPKELEEIEEQV